MPKSRRLLLKARLSLGIKLITAREERYVVVRLFEMLKDELVVDFVNDRDRRVV